MFSNKNNQDIGILDHKGYYKNPLTGEPYSKQYKIYSLTSEKPWSKLPMAKYRKEIIQNITNNRVNIITAGTGAGKSVIVPRCALHAVNYKGKVAMTVPKRMLAKGAAEWTAKNLDVELGKEVGFQHRDSIISAGTEIEVKGTKIKVTEDRPSYDKSLTKLLFATDGTINGKILNNKYLEKPGSLDIIIIDEAHERSKSIDLLLYLTKQILENNKNFKLIILSATIDTTLFSNYYSDFNPLVSEYPGATPFKTQLSFLNTPSANYITDGAEQIHNILTQKKERKNIFNNGAILMFVPTLGDARKVCEELEKLKIQKQGYMPFCVELSSKVSKKDKEYAVHIDKYKSAQDGPYTRKVVTSTNIAESSITIDGIGYIIDSGLELNINYNPFRDSEIIEKKFISRAQAKQRWGRVGRRDEGRIYCLYTNQEYIDFDIYPEPEITIKNIEGLLLNISQIAEPEVGRKKININDVVNILEDFITPPDSIFIETAIDNIKLIGCLDESQNFTNLGITIGKLMLPPRFGRILLESIVYNEKLMGIKLSAILTAIGSIEGIVGFSKMDESNGFVNNTSEVLTILNIYNGFSSLNDEEQIKFCEDNKFKYDALKKIEKVIESIEKTLDESPKLFSKIEIMKVLNIKNKDIIQYESSNDLAAHLILSGTVMNLSKKLKSGQFRNCIPNIIDSFSVKKSSIKSVNFEYLIYGSITVFQEKPPLFGLLTLLSKTVIKNLKKRLNNNYIQCLQKEEYTPEDIEKFKKRLQITDDFNKDHIPELNILNLKNFVASETDTDWSLFWPLYISPDLAALPRLSQLLRQFNRDAADVGTLNDDLIFGTDMIVHKASDTINLIKIVTGSYEQLLNKYDEKLEEIEQKEKAVNKLKDKLGEFKGQIGIIISKLNQNSKQIRTMQLKLDTLDQKNKDDAHKHSKFLKSVITLEKVILPNTIKKMKLIEVNFEKKKVEFQQKLDELERKNEETQIVEDALNMMKTKLEQIVLIKGGGLVVNNVVNQYGGLLKNPLQIKTRAILKPLSNNKIIFKTNQQLFEKFDNEEIIHILNYNKLDKNYIKQNNRNHLTSVFKLLILAKINKIDDKQNLKRIANMLNMKNIHNLSYDKLKEKISKKIKL